jgi:hypothetical protein
MKGFDKKIDECAVHESISKNSLHLLKKPSSEKRSDDSFVSCQ